MYSSQKVYSSVQEENWLAYITQDENGERILTTHQMFQRQETLQGPMLSDIISFSYITNKAGNPNIITHREAMKADNNDKFLESMRDEMDKIFGNNIYEVVHQPLVPHHNTVLDAVWSHQRK